MRATTHRFRFVVPIFAAAAACSSSSAPSSDTADTATAAETTSDAPVDETISTDPPPPGAIDAIAERVDAALHARSITTSALAKSTTELFVQEDPTIDTAKAAAENAASVAAQITASVKACANAKVTYATGSVSLSVTFGDSCTINGSTFSGTVAATVSKVSGTIGIAFTFTKLTVNGMTIDGTASESTTNGTSYSAKVDVTEATNHVTYDGTMTLDSDAKGVTMTGTGSLQQGASPAVKYAVSGVHHRFGGCYADLGTLSYTKAVTGKNGKTYSVAESIAFDSNTPSTGNATATIAGQSAPVVLPPYGSCPHA